MSLTENPRAVAGDNEAPDYAHQVTARMLSEYRQLGETVTDLIDEAHQCPAEIVDDEQMGAVARVIKRMKDCCARVEGIRIKEKEPFLRGGNAVDQFFGGMAIKLLRLKKSEAPGVGDLLQARLDKYNQAKLAAERARRDEEARLAREAAAETERVRREEAERVRLAEAAAARARNAASVTARTNEANAAAAREATAAVAAETARVAASETRLAAAAPAADMVRARLDDGVMVTMRQVPYVELVDDSLLDAAVLWPFVKTEHKLAALKAWAKITQHKKPMAGAIIEMRDESVVR